MDRLTTKQKLLMKVENQKRAKNLRKENWAGKKLFSYE